MIVSRETIVRYPACHSCLSCSRRWFRISYSTNSSATMPCRISSQVLSYRQFHSTETAVNELITDLLLAADQGQVSALCLLDLTAAFDTVDHSLLLTRLQKCFGVEGCCLEWFSSYLSGRSYCGVVDGVSSKVIYIICSVPQ